MSYNKLIQPKQNPFGLYIYSTKENSIIYKTFPQNTISKYNLSNFKGTGTYCNSYSQLYISEGNSFWIINHSSFQIRYKKMPISKINHSIIFVPSFNPESEEGKIFIVGGEDKKAFYYDLKKNYFIKWESTNELHTKPALLVIGEYLYLFDSLQQENYCFERTKLTDNKSKWEKIVPNFDENIKVNFPSQTFAVSLDSENRVVFLGGDNVEMSNNSTYIYDINENRIYLSEKGTNDSMNFIDKTFYKIDDNYTIALPEGLDELKEIAIIDKNEQSLIRNNVDGKIYNINNTKFAYNNTLCNECKKEYENENNNKQNLKSADIKKVIISEPKEFGYCISSCSNEQSKIKAKNDKIKVIEYNKNINIEQKQKQEVHIELNKIENKENIPVNQEIKEEEHAQENQEIKEEEYVQENQDLKEEEHVQENQETKEEQEIEHEEKQVQENEQIEEQQQENEQYEEHEEQQEQEHEEEHGQMEEIPHEEEINTDINQNGNVNINNNKEGITESRNIENNNVLIKDGVEENNEKEKEQNYEYIDEQPEKVLQGEEHEHQEEHEQEQEHEQEEHQEEHEHEEEAQYEEQVENNEQIGEGEFEEQNNAEQPINLENLEEEHHEEEHHEKDYQQEPQNVVEEHVEYEGELQEDEEHVEHQEGELVEENQNVNEDGNIEENQRENNNINEIGEVNNENGEEQLQEQNKMPQEAENQNQPEPQENRNNEEDAKVLEQMQNQLEFKNEQIHIDSQKEQNQVNVEGQDSKEKGEINMEKHEQEERNVMISQENPQSDENEMGMGDMEHEQEQEQHYGEGNEEEGDEIHHENGQDIHQLNQEGREIEGNEENAENYHPGNEGEGEEEGEEGEEYNEEEMFDEEHVENNEEGNENVVENDNNGEVFIHHDYDDENNPEAEEVNFNEENNEEENGEYDNMEEQEQNEERDTIEKTLTQNIGEDVMQIPEQPIFLYYNPENFCDYIP